MSDTKTITYVIIIGALIVLAIYFMGGNGCCGQKNSFSPAPNDQRSLDQYGCLECSTPFQEYLPTSAEVQYIQGVPDIHAVNPVDGMELIYPNDMSLSPGFGVGEGTFGFGRFGSSFMA